MSKETQLPVQDNLCWKQGDDIFVRFNYKESNGDLVNLQSAQMDLKARVSEYAPDFSSTATINNNAQNGEVHVELFFPSALTDLMVTDGKTQSQYFYDVEVTDSLSLKTTLISGKITVKADITKTEG